MKDIHIDVLTCCYPNFVHSCVYHAIDALEQGKITEQQLGAYLDSMENYFLLNGDFKYARMGLVPLDSKNFYDKKLADWLNFWEIDENSIIGTMIHNAKVGGGLKPRTQ